MDTQALQAASASRPVPVDFRRTLERSWEVDLSAVGIHSGPHVDALLRVRGAAAAATGNEILIATAFREDSPTWRRLVAHEAAHVVQQARGAAGAVGALSGRTSAALLERAADAAARAALAGRRFGDLLAVRTEGAGVLQCFNAWEHQLLGDCTRAELLEIAANSPAGKIIVGQMRDAVGLWQTNTKVTAADLRVRKSNLEVFTLPNGCVATRGELNAIAADFVASPQALRTLRPTVMLGFLQQVRQETFNRLNARLSTPTEARFASSITEYHSPETWDPTADGTEAMAIDQFTKDNSLGYDHYSGLLARNACHFVPYSWHRFKAFHEAARALATQSLSRTFEAQKELLLTDAWLTQCYADHFLQDSFAAGHLTNKTLVMQWYTEWLESSLGSVMNWDTVKYVTTQNQPKLWGPALYDPLATIASNDPQTALELATHDARRDATGVQAFSTFNINLAYLQYLHFLDTTVIQLSTNVVHNAYNASGLKVKSNSAASPYQIYGDESMLKSGDAVQQIALAMELTKASLTNILSGGGQPAIDIKAILDHLPTQLVLPIGGKPVPLDVWHKGGLHQYCVDNLFGGVASYFKRAAVHNWNPTMGSITVDLPS